MNFIILIQFNQNINSRTYSYFNTYEEVVKHILGLYESFLHDGERNEADKSQNKIKIIQLKDVLTFLYSLYDFAYFEMKEAISDDGSSKKVYQPYGKDWFSNIFLNKLT